MTKTAAAPASLENVDVAVSYLTRDGKVAEDLYGRLADQFSAFLYPRYQEHLAGRDGMETLRKVFLSGTRLVVILYRSDWGDTPWTAVERDAIRDRALAEKGWHSVVMVRMDNAKLPAWYPTSLVHYDYTEYGLEQLLGVVKSKLQELGAKPKKPNPLDKAARVAAEVEFRTKRQEMMESHQGVNAVREQFEHLCVALQQRVAAIHEQSPGIAFKFGHDKHTITISSSVSMQAVWIPPYANRVGPMDVLWTNFGLALPGQMAFFPEKAERHELARWKVVPELTGAYQWVWAPSRQPDLRLTTDELADYLLQEFLEYYGKRASGEISPPSMDF